MASQIAKLRELHKKESEQKAKIIKDLRNEAPRITRTVEYSTHDTKKIVFDKKKLHETIEKAKQHADMLKKKPIVVLDKVPSHHNPVIAAAPVAVVICKARNLNGTPCKCKATKFGKFCAKHTP
jgi:predicted Holliday junction resolvase-like endonuclease